METEVPSFLTLEPSNGFNLSVTKKILLLYPFNLSDQVLQAQRGLDFDK